MELLAQPSLLAAAGYSFVYLLAGGGVLGAIVIFFVAKMLRKIRDRGARRLATDTQPINYLYQTFKGTNHV